MQRVRKLVGGDLQGEIDGSGVTVAVLDTGLSRHPDLLERPLCFRDFVNHNDLMYDNNGHGTHVCGILCGDGRLSAGKYRGIAPGVGLVIGKVLDERGDGSAETMLQGMNWVLEEKDRYGIRILNISVGIGCLEQLEKERALQRKVEELWESGILVICAAGNKGPGDSTISSVGGSNRVVTVGCHDGLRYAKENPGSCETYSGRGSSGSGTRKPDVVAPGTDIISCNAWFRRGNGRFINAYTVKSGTSMATPIVSGAAALALQKYPDMTNEECKQKLQFTAADLGIEWNRQGWGMVNISRLLS